MLDKKLDMDAKSFEQKHEEYYLNVNRNIQGENKIKHKIKLGIF